MKLFSRIAALVLALALCLGLFSTAIAEDVTQDKDQITFAGGTVFYNDKGKQLENVEKLGDKDGEDVAVVEMTKTVSQPDDYLENEFEITLQVKTTSLINDIGPVSQDAAVLLIFDLSSSMNNQDMTKTTENGNPQKITRLAAAKEAANNFIDEFSKLEGDGKRMVGLVTFSTHAGSYNWNYNRYDQERNPVYWIDVSSNNTTQNREWVNQKINDLKADGGTNLEAGLMLGCNLLADGQTKTPENGGIKDIQHVYTILLTDGKPTYHVPNHNNSGNIVAVYGPNRSNNDIDNTGSSTEYDDVVNVGIMANGSKDGTIKGITNYSKLYSICFGKDNNNNNAPIYNTYLKPAESNNNSSSGGGPGNGGFNPGSKPTPPTPTPDPATDYWDVTIQKNDYKIAGTTYPKNESETNVVSTVGEWLSAFSSAKAFDAQTDDMSGLFSSFNSIIAHIELSTKAWQVDDKMGDNIEFVTSIDIIDETSSNPDEKVTNFATPPSAANNNTLHWNLLSSEPDPNITEIKTGEGETSTVGYTYKYKVRLNNLAEGFKAETAVDTNAFATLKYAVLKDGVLVPNPDENSDGTYTVAFPQPKVQGLVGNLTFTKVDGSGAALKGATFELSLDTEKDKTGSWTSLTAESDENGTVSFSNIPSGHSYTLTETKAPDNYNLDSTPRTVEIKYGKAYENDQLITNPDQLQITNTAKTGSLKITKTNTGATPNSVTFTVTGPSPATTSREVTLSSANNWEATIENLPVGTYTVTETNADVDNYSYSTTVEVNGTDEALTNNGVTVEVNAGENNSVTVAFTNNYTKTTGSLNIKKLFSFFSNNESTDAPANTPSAVTVMVAPNTDSSAAPAVSMTPFPVIIKAEEEWKATVPNLPLGEYTITEVSTTERPLDITGWTLTTPAPVNYYVSSVAPDTTDRAEISNTYERDTGKLTIVKAFDKAVTNYIPADAEVKVTVTGLNNNYSETVTLSYSNSWTAVLENLPIGTYTVKEISYPNIDGFILKDTTYNKQSFENGLTATVTKNGFFVAIENTYEKLAELTIKKEFAGDLTVEDFADKSIEFTVSGGTLDSAKTVTLNKANNWVDSIKLPAGEYTVAEAAPVNVDNYTHTVSYKQGAVTENADKVTLAVGATVTVTATNTYTRDTGSLKIEKAFEDLPDTVRPESVKFTVTSPDNYKNEDVTLSAANGWSYTLENLPVGTYTVTEQEGSANVNGYTCTVSYGDTGNTVDITKDATVIVTATNTYARIDGGLTIKKAFDFQYNGTSTPAPAPTPSAIEVKVAPAASNGPAVSMTPIPVTLEAKNNWEATVDNLPVGDYTVTEVSSTEHPLDITGWTLTTPAPTTVTVQNTTEPVKVNIENTYTRDTGKLTITKTNKGATPQSVEFTVTGTNYSSTVTLNAGNNWTTTLPNLPTGTYTITETSADVDNYARTTTVSVNNGTAQALTNNGVSVEVKAGEGNSVTVAFTNTYEANPGQLKLVKSIAYSEGSVEKDAAVREVTLTVSRVGVGNSLETVGSYTLNAENGWQTVIDVPAGTYYVTETAQAYKDTDYTVETTYTNQTVTVAPGQKVTDGVTTNVVTVTNTYTRNTGSLKVIKTLDGAVPGPSERPNIKFTLNGPDGYSDEKETGVLRYDNTNSVELVFDDLPTGTYTITETNYDYFAGEYVCTTTVTVNNEPETITEGNNGGRGTTAEVTSGGSTTVHFTNTYAKNVGSLTITKAFDGLPDTVRPEYIKVNVTRDGEQDPCNSVELTAENGWTATINSLPIGEYTVTEVTDSAAIAGYTLTGTEYSPATDGKVSITFGNKSEVEITNTYELKEAVTVVIPVTKVVERGEKGNVDPTGNRTFKFEMTIGEAQAASELDDDSKKLPLDKLLVKFNGNTITPDEENGCYYFELTVNGLGEATGTLTVSFNPDMEISNYNFYIGELGQSKSGYSEDSCWAYDESVYGLTLYVHDDGETSYELGKVEGELDDQSMDVRFTNVYTKTSTPEIDVPVTGDNSRIGLYMAMMLLSAAGLAVICKRRTAKR